MRPVDETGNYYGAVPNWCKRVCGEPSAIVPLWTVYRAKDTNEGMCAFVNAAEGGPPLIGHVAVAPGCQLPEHMQGREMERVGLCRNGGMVRFVDVDAVSGELVTSRMAGRYARRRDDAREPEYGFEDREWLEGWDEEDARLALEADQEERIPPEACPGPCAECPPEGHHFGDSYIGTAENDPGHPAAKAGHELWYGCKHCDAYVLDTDEEDDGPTVDCGTCDGSGKAQRDLGNGRWSDPEDCETCEGTGKVDAPPTSSREEALRRAITSDPVRLAEGQALIQEGLTLAVREAIPPAVSSVEVTHVSLVETPPNPDMRILQAGAPRLVPSDDPDGPGFALEIDTSADHEPS